MFSATRLQVCTYLLGVCLFSIAFLVFLNASLSFVVTDLVGLKEGVGDAVGTLGFADEVLAVFACPLWGLLSDRIGVRYPDPRGGHVDGSTRDQRRSSSSSAIRLGYQRSGGASRLAGVVGTLTGSGAVFALLVLLPLPARFERAGMSAVDAVKSAFYVAAAIAGAVSVFCLLGFRRLTGERPGNWKAAFRHFGRPPRDLSSGELEGAQHEAPSYCPASYWSQFRSSLALGLTCPNIGLAYIGGFVARASSVGISLFVPLYVNQFYRHAGLCDNRGLSDAHATSDDSNLKQSCLPAYIAASILTGVSQTVALCTAPLLGYLSSRSHRHNLPMLAACFAGVIGYPLFALLPSPEIRGNAGAFVSMILVGISQIGAIVCSLGLLGDEVISKTKPSHGLTTPASTETLFHDELHNGEGERASLLHNTINHTHATRPQQPLMQHRGAIAGVYSLSGAAGILILTKLGGLMSDTTSPAAPFYMLAGFNAILLAAGMLVSARRLVGP
ncbi:hypothetical protein KEM52_006041 [Ascosphaera acerosa]|nr:hypothetical protein KEM52_006041 [Ascosphaera acerosa]